jgi:DNA-binding phage protein
MSLTTSIKSSSNSEAAELIEIDNPITLCATLRSAIANSRMTYKDIAKKAGISPQTIGRMACGETKDPRCNTAINILRVCGYKLYIVKV